MSKVLFLVNHEVVIYNFRLEIVERLLADGHEVIISSPYGEKIEKLKKLGCKYKEINLARHGMNPFHEFGLIFAYKKLMKEIKPDIVFSFTIKPNLYGALICRLLNIPFVANITGLGTAIENGGLLQKILTTFYKLAFAKVQRVFVQNEENKKFFVDNNIAIDRLKLIPGSGVNLERFMPIEFPSEDKPIEFAFISRIMKEKGIDQYLETAETIKAKYPETVFHVCGFCETEYEGRLKEFADKGIVNYHGMIRDIKTILRDVSCVIHPSYYPEGISNVLLESSACARPIITTDRSGCREVIDDGINGFIVKQKNSKDLIKIIEKFLFLPYSKKIQMGIAGRKKVESTFNRQIVVDAYVNELLRVSHV